jgi:excisionase family DNA binding protein
MDLLMMAIKPEREKVEPELLTVEQVAQLTTLGVRTVWSLVSEGSFPRPVKIGRATRWRRSQVMSWVDSLDENL